MHTSATIRPAYGLIAVASTVTRAGPVTKITSSATDSKAKAVFSFAEPPYRRDQRARTIEPRESEVAPTSRPEAYRVHCGRPRRALSMSATSATALSAAKGMITRLWPNRSTRRPDRGAATAKEMLEAAATAPAIAYDPVSPWTSSTIPMPSMDIGIRPMNPASTKPLTPGPSNNPR